VIERARCAIRSPSSIPASSQFLVGADVFCSIEREKYGFRAIVMRVVCVIIGVFADNGRQNRSIRWLFDGVTLVACWRADLRCQRPA